MSVALPIKSPYLLAVINISPVYCRFPRSLVTASSVSMRPNLYERHSVKLIQICEVLLVAILPRGQISGRVKYMIFYSSLPCGPAMLKGFRKVFKKFDSLPLQLSIVAQSLLLVSEKNTTIWRVV